MAKTVHAESKVRLMISEAQPFAGEPTHINFTAVFKRGNFCQGSISSEGEIPVQVRFPQLGIEMQFGWDLKPILPKELAREIRDMAHALSKSLLEDQRCKDFMREHGFRKQRLD